MDANTDRRYIYLGTRGTDPELVGQECDLVAWHRSKALVRFAGGVRVVVIGRRLRRIKGGTDD